MILRSTNTTSEYIFNDWPNLEARQIRQAYHSFATICPPTTSSALFTATGCLLDKIKLKQDKLETLENLGVLLLILENPLLLDSQYHNSIVGTY